MKLNDHRPDILYLVHRVPYPPDKGDRIRAYNILRFLSERARVHLACLADEPVTEDIQRELQSLCYQVAIHPVGKTRWLHALGSFLRGGSITEGAFTSFALLATLREWKKHTQFTAALASASSMVPYLRLPELQNIPAVVDLVDVDSQKWLDYSKLRSWPLSQIYAAEGRRLRNLERNLTTWTRAVTLVSEAETALFREFSRPGGIHTVTNGVHLDPLQGDKPKGAENDCIFVGALDYFPNIDAAVWFCKDVWPTIYARNPQATFSLVGRRPTPAVTQLAAIPGVKVVGQVPDVRPHLARAAIAVIPLRIARGLQNKVIEALAMSKAVVASPQALAALGTIPGTHLLSASSPEEWQNAILRLLQDKPLRQQLGTAGRTYVEQQHNWDACLEPLAHLLELPGSDGISSPSHHQEKTISVKI